MSRVLVFGGDGMLGHQLLRRLAVMHVMCGLRKEGVLEAVAVATERYKRLGRSFRIHPDYDVDDVASKVVNVILGYTGYVNRNVWRKPD